MKSIYTKLYRILKKDMIKKLSEKHGEQFIDDVMETFGMPTNLMDKYQGDIKFICDGTKWDVELPGKDKPVPKKPMGSIS